MEALGAHSAYSTHYCSQEQGSEEEEEDEGASLESLRESLQVTLLIPSSRSLFWLHLLNSSFMSPKPGGRGEPQETGGGDGRFSVHAENRRAGRE